MTPLSYLDLLRLSLPSFIDVGKTRSREYKVSIERIGFR